MYAWFDIVYSFVNISFLSFVFRFFLYQDSARFDISKNAKKALESFYDLFFDLNENTKTVDGGFL